MIYLTVNDAPSGIFKSQVIDVIKELNTHLDKPIKLVVFISYRNYSDTRKKIKNWYSNSRVIPMYPRLKNWKKNRVLFKLVGGAKNENIIARGPMAANIAMGGKGKVVYDGRGAIKAELEEFPDIIPDKIIVQSLIEAEKNAVLKSDYRIAVTQKLVDYWTNEFAYSGNEFVIIPCTLSDSINNSTDNKEKILNELGWSVSDKVLIYSGSVDGWQSFSMLKGMIKGWIEDQNIKVLFLSKESSEIDELMQSYPESVKRKWLDHSEVAANLSIGDYGILIREKNVTNRVAAPVKFAEYVAAGLRVLISEELGDYSALVEQDNLGIVVGNDPIQFEKVSQSEKDRLIEYARAHFTKSANRNKFLQLLKFLDGKS